MSHNQVTTTNEVPDPCRSPDQVQRPDTGSSHVTTDLTRGSLPRNLWFLAWPQMTEGLLTVVTNTLDLVWIGRVGFHAVAGLGVGQLYVVAIVALRGGIDAAARAMIARAYGARKVSRANYILVQTLGLTAIYHAIVLSIGLPFAEPMLKVLGLTDEIVSQTAMYLRVQFIASAILAFQSVTGGALQASGDSVTPLRAETVNRLVHIVLSPILIFGWLGAPDLGLTGVAFASLSARSLSVGLNFYVLIRGTTRLRIDRRGYSPDFHLMGQILKVGLPAGVTGLQRGLSPLVIVMIIAPFGDAAVAAMTILRRVEALATQAGQPLGRAAGAIVGQNLGVAQRKRAKDTVWWALGLILVLSVAVTVSLFVFAEHIATFINPDPNFVYQSTQWLRIVAVGYSLFSLSYFFVHTFNTSGSTLFPMLVMVGTLWLVDVPLAYVLANFTGLAENGVPYALVIGSFLRLALFAWYFGRGKWLRIGMI